MNTPEWVYICVGCISSIAMGCSMPAFAVIFGDIMGVSTLGYLYVTNITYLSVIIL
jgi:hypothetical protein